MALAEDFSELVEVLPGDWTDIEFDLRIFDESRYVEAAVFLVVCNPRPYSRSSWHWQIAVAHRFGHAASVGAVHSSLARLDRAGITGEIELRGVRSGRAEVVPMWGRPESVRSNYRRINAQ